MRQRLKVLLRWPAKFIYRLLRPFVRPIAFRLRAYLINALRAEIGDLRRDVSDSRRDVEDFRREEGDFRRELGEVRREAQDLHLQSRHDIQRLDAKMESFHHASHAEQLKHSASLIQELQATRDFLEADIFKLSAAIVQQLRAMADPTATARLASHSCSQQSSQLDRIESYAGAAAGRIAVNCGNDEILVRAEVGYVLCHGSDQALISVLIDSGDTERGTRLLIERLLRPDDVFIDVGAHVGLHALAAARAMHGRGRIIAFEPNAETCRLLEKSVKLNGFSEITEIHQAAVSTATGCRPLYLGEASGDHSLLPPQEAHGHVPDQVEVPLARIDDFVDCSQPVALIKIDVEGAELDVLESARGVIQCNPDIAVIVEFGMSDLRRQRCESSEWLAAFTGMGLVYRAINAETGVLEDWSLGELESVGSINLLFARAGAPALAA